MELGDSEVQTVDVPSEGSQPSMPNKETWKAKSKPRKKRHHQANSNHAQNLAVISTSPATKKPCFSDSDFPPLGNNAKNAQQKGTLDGIKEKTSGSTTGAVKITPVSNTAVSLTPVSSDGQTGPSRIVMIKGAPSGATTSGKESKLTPPAQSPFQKLAASITAAQVAMNDKIAVVQKLVNDGIDMVKKLITDPGAGVEPRVSKLEEQVPVITNLKNTVGDRKSGLVRRVNEVEASIQKLSTQTRVVPPPSEGENQVNSESPELIRRLYNVEKQVQGQEATLDLVVAWAGSLQRSQNSIHKQVQFNTSKHHANDLLVGGIYEYKKQDCRKAALKFFRERMKLSVADSEVLRAYRTGQPREYEKDGLVIRCPRQMVVKCTPRLRDLAIQNRKTLGGQKDPKGNFSFFVAQYLPEPFKAARERYRDDIADILKKNEKQLPKYHKTAKVV